MPHVFPIVRPGLLPIQSIRRLRRLVRLEGELQGWAGAVASGGAFEAFQFSVAHRRGSRDSWEYFFFFLKRSFIKIDQLLRRKLTWSFFSLSLTLLENQFFDKHDIYSNVRWTSDIAAAGYIEQVTSSFPRQERRRFYLTPAKPTKKGGRGTR